MALKFRSIYCLLDNRIMPKKSNSAICIILNKMVQQNDSNLGYWGQFIAWKWSFGYFAIFRWNYWQVKIEFLPENIEILNFTPPLLNRNFQVDPNQVA